MAVGMKKNFVKESAFGTQIFMKDFEKSYLSSYFTSFQIKYDL